MRRLSWSDWYKHLESQFVEEPLQETPANAPEKPSDPPASRSISAQPQEPAVASLEPRPPAEPQKTRQVSQPDTESDASTETSTPAHLSVRVPSILEFLPFLREELGLPPENAPTSSTSPSVQQAVVEIDARQEDGPRLRKRRRRKKPDPEQIVPPEADEVWAKLPQYLRYLAEWTDDSVTRRYYPARIRESREELIARLTDPVLTLEEVARLLGVCPATVRRYTDRGWLQHFRTEGNQRRFRLSDVVAFLEEQALRRPLGNRNARQSASEEADETP